MTSAERGSTIPLLVFCCALGLTVTFLVVASTSLYLERKQLFTLADGAALAATEQFGVNDLGIDGAGVTVHLQNDAVRVAVDSYLRDAEPTVSQLRTVRADAPDGRTARVTLAAVWHPPIVGQLFASEWTLEVTSQARTVFR